MNPGVTGLNYQTFYQNFCKGISYEELEEVYKKKTNFTCTAAFSSLLFHEQKGLRKGGFFMRSPMLDSFDLVDMAWAIVADIACSIHEQVLLLAEITTNVSEKLYCCGGGFQSATLCQMLSDLTLRDVVLKKGFNQATVEGFVNICNESLGEINENSSVEPVIYKPRTDKLIHEYRPVWLENRNRSNEIVG